MKTYKSYSYWRKKLLNECPNVVFERSISGTLLYAHGFWLGEKRKVAIWDYEEKFGLIDYKGI